MYLQSEKENWRKGRSPVGREKVNRGADVVKRLQGASPALIRTDAPEQTPR